MPETGVKVPTKSTFIPTSTNYQVYHLFSGLNNFNPQLAPKKQKNHETENPKQPASALSDH